MEILNPGLAMQLGGAGGGTPATPSPAPAPTTAQAQPQQNPTSAGSGSVPSQYSEQLAQMREMGIFDERLSLMALRVSEGDVATAVELVFSGWQGEGLEWAAGLNMNYLGNSPEFARKICTIYQLLLSNSKNIQADVLFSKNLLVIDGVKLFWIYLVC